MTDRPGYLTLANGVAIPPIGYGTWPIGDREVETMVRAAIEAGYRLIDTAELYGNEPGVGRGIRASGVDRSEVMVTTKLSQRSHGRFEARKAFEASASRLGLDYIDLFLIHWPNPDLDRYVDAWRGLIDLLEQGKVRAIGVSNFMPSHLQRLIDETGVVPHLNQIQLNPWVTRVAEREFHSAHHIVTESWSPIGKGGGLLADPVIAGLAARRSRSPAQIVIRWHLQLGLVPIPKTADRRRLLENIDVFDFTLADEEIKLLSTLDRGGVGAVDSDHTGL
ncbi:MAG TPA: aldo/keto reductase [Acidimicrobiia bacterium]|nr:aldo/keto reductase [Acidimicrobiia bacterium]